MPPPGDLSLDDAFEPTNMSIEDFQAFLIQQISTIATNPFRHHPQLDKLLFLQSQKLPYFPHGFHPNFFIQIVTQIMPPTQYTTTLLHLAIYHGHLRWIDWIVSCPNIDLSIKDSQSFTPLMLCAKMKQPRSIFMLSTAHNWDIINVLIYDNERNNALHHAILAKSLTCVQTILRLLCSNPSETFIKQLLHAQNNVNQTPLNLAIASDDVEICRALLIFGRNFIDINFSDVAAQSAASSQPIQDLFRIFITYHEQTALNQINNTQRR